MATPIQLYGLDLIATSLRLLNRLGEGETPSGAMALDALAALETLVDSWRIERLMIGTVRRTVWPLTQNLRGYQIGPGQPWGTDLPVWIDAAAMMEASPSLVTHPIPVLSTSEYNAMNNLGEPSAFPMRGVYYDKWFDANITYGVIYLVETPSVAGLRLALYQAMDSAAANIQDLSTTLYNLPPGYARALKYNLAKELSDDYPGSWTAALEMKALESKASIKRLNEVPGVLRCDPFWTNRGFGYDIMRGE